MVVYIVPWFIAWEGVLVLATTVTEDESLLAHLTPQQRSVVLPALDEALVQKYANSSYQDASEIFEEALGAGKWRRDAHGRPLHAETNKYIYVKAIPERALNPGFSPGTTHATIEQLIAEVSRVFPIVSEDAINRLFHNRNFRRGVRRVYHSRNDYGAEVFKLIEDVVEIFNTANELDSSIAKEKRLHAGGPVAIPIEDYLESGGNPGAARSNVDALVRGTTGVGVMEIKQERVLNDVRSDKALLKLNVAAIGVAARIGLILAGAKIALYFFHQGANNALIIHKLYRGYGVEVSEFEVYAKSFALFLVVLHA